jgi:hypothetical protein
MDTPTLFLGTGQLVLTLAVGYMTYVIRRDSKRSSLADLVTLLSDLREKNSKALTTSLTLMSSDEFRQGDEQLRDGLIDSTNRLRAVQAAITEALLHTVHECDTEWGLRGRLHAAFRSQVNVAADKDSDRVLTH